MTDKFVNVDSTCAIRASEITAVRNLTADGHGARVVVSYGRNEHPMFHVVDCADAGAAQELYDALMQELNDITADQQAAEAHGTKTAQE